MPRQDHSGGSQSPSRRMVLRGAAGAGAAGVAATALSGLGGSAYAAEATTDQENRNADANALAPSVADDGEQFVVHVKDARTGQIDVFRGSSQIRLHDRDLAGLLDRISRR